MEKNYILPNPLLFYFRSINKLRRLYLIVPVLLLISSAVFAQKIEKFPGDMSMDTLYLKDIDAFTRVPARFGVFDEKGLISGREVGPEKTATFIVNYTGFTPQAQAAFQRAVDIWSTEIYSDVPIVINANWRPLGPGVLGSAGSNFIFRNFPNSRPDIYYSSALADAIAGVDLNPGDADIIANFSSEMNWYYGLDANTPAGLTDLTSVVLHEIGHGLGFFGSASETSFGYGNPVAPTIFDIFVETEEGVRIVSLPFRSPEQLALFISNNLFINSPAVVAALGRRAKIYAPEEFDQGSSYSHWDEDEFPEGDPNSLMTPFLASAEGIHDIGDIVRGLFQDMGWRMANFIAVLETDIGVTSINAPLQAPDLGEEETVTVTVVNYGKQDVSNFPIAYQIEEEAIVQETFTGTLESGESASYSFNNKVDVSADGQELFIKAFTALASDQNKSNDTATATLRNLVVAMSLPYEESFEDGPGGWYTEGKNSSWELGEPSGDIINTASDGENAWVTNLDGDYNPYENSWVASPIFDFAGLQDPTIEFDIFWDTETEFDGAALQYSLDFGETWQHIGSVGDPVNWYNGEASSLNFSGNMEGWQGYGSDGSNKWVTARHTLNGLRNKSNVILRVVFGSDSFEHAEGFAFDNVKITADPLSPIDIHVVKLEMPENSCDLTNEEEVVVLLENLGSSDLSNFSISYKVDAGPVIREFYRGTLKAGDSATYTFKRKVDLSVEKTYDIIVFVTLASDANRFNNVIGAKVIHVPYITEFPYKESFETSAAGWSSGGINSSWKWGRPTKRFIVGGADGSKSWSTKLTGYYNNNEQSYVLSPCFDLTKVQNPYVLLNIAYDTELGVDGTNLQASTDDGETWETVGTLGEPWNWYTANATAVAYTGSLASWTGTSGPGRNKWIRAVHGLEQFAENEKVRFRIAFGSNGSIVKEGFAFDNFQIVSESDLLTIVCPSDIVVSNDPGECGATVEVPLPQIKNNTGDVVITNTFNEGADASGFYPVGITTVTFTVNEMGFTRSCSITVEVKDTELPVVECPEDIVVASYPGSDGEVVEYEAPMATDNCLFPITLTQSGNQTIAAGSVRCPAGENGYLRVFDPAAFDITGDFALTSVDIAIRLSNSPSGSEMAWVNIYALTGNLTFANMQLVATTEVMVPNMTSQFINVPIRGVIPAGAKLVVELRTPNGSSINPGTNAEGSTAPSYIYAPSCGITQPTSVAAIGFPTSQYIFNVNGGDVAETGREAVMVAGLGSGAVFPLGKTTETYRATDAAGNVGECSFTVEVILPDMVEDLQLTAMCSPDPGAERMWRIRNPNDFAVPVSWVLFGTEQKGMELAPVGDSYFSTEAVEGENIVLIYWKDEDGKEQKDINISGGSRCYATARLGDGMFEDNGDLSNYVARFSVNAYPNPVMDKITVELTTDGEYDVTFKLFDATGHVLIDKVQKSRLDFISTDLDLSKLSHGIYYLKVESDAKELNQIIKVVKN